MATEHSALTCEQLRELFEYDADSGVFTRMACADRSHVGDSPSALDEHGYIRFRVAGRKYRAHRLAWLYVFGEWPQYQLDHMDGNPMNNRIGNLRDVPQSMNQHNRRKPRIDNACGFLGVDAMTRTSFRAQIVVSGKKLYLGAFASAEEAHEAYRLAKEKHHDGFLGFN